MKDLALLLSVAIFSNGGQPRAYHFASQNYLRQHDNRGVDDNRVDDGWDVDDNRGVDDGWNAMSPTALCG